MCGVGSTGGAVQGVNVSRSLSRRLYNKQELIETNHSRVLPTGCWRILTSVSNNKAAFSEICFINNDNNNNNNKKKKKKKKKKTKKKKKK